MTVTTETYEYRVMFKHFDGTVVEDAAGLSEDAACRAADRVEQSNREFWVERRPVPEWERVQLRSTRACTSCGQIARPCSNAHDGEHGPAAWHCHEYDEWYCQACADGYGDQFDDDGMMRKVANTVDMSGREPFHAAGAGDCCHDSASRAARFR